MNIEPVKIHRLKNQLAIILGFCELLLEETHSARQMGLASAPEGGSL